MNLRRIFVAAVIRRLAYAVVALAIAALVIGNARAAVCGVPTQAEVAVSGGSSTLYSTREAAYNACRAAVGQTIVNTQNNNVISTITLCERNGSLNHHRLIATSSGTRHTAQCSTTTQGAGTPGAVSTVSTGWAWSSECAPGQIYNPFANQCQATCSGRPSSVQTFLPLSGSKQCFGGCVVTYMQNGDDTTSTRSYSGAMCGNDQFKQDCGSGYFWNGYMGVCQPVQPDCPTGQVLVSGGQCKPENQCPDGMVSVPGSTPGAIQQGALYCKPSEDTCPQGMVRAPSGQCLPGDGQCAAGEARRKDGTCGKDDNGDGTADDEDEDDTNDSDKESFSGGDSCTAPPSCAGGPIDCGMARIQWRIDCNTRTKVNITGGACEAVPQCVGENCRAMEYAQLLQQWRTACALEKMADAGAGDGPVGDANKNGVADVLEGNFTPSTGGTGDTETGVSVKTVGTSLLNTDNIFGAGACPQPPTFQIMGVTVSGADFPHWCNAMVILRGCILIFGAFTAVKILMGWGF